MFHQQSVATVINEFDTDPVNGLSKDSSAKRLKESGPNILPTKPPPSLLFKFIGQFKDTLILILLGATIVSLLLGDFLDATAILAIVLLNATIAFIQEFKAEKTLESLKQKDILYALVIRHSIIEKIPFPDIVPGDIIILEEGSKVPADARVIESFSLRVDESILTGESHPVTKYTDIINIKSPPLADRRNMIYMNTQIVAGRGKAVVVTIGKNTEIGKIAQFLSVSQSSKSPLTQELEKVSHTLTGVIGLVAVLVFVVNIVLKTPLVDSFLIAISLAVAAIPEGLPAIVTIVLSLGVKRLAEKKTIVKILPAVETLGAIRIIATDKTGTLTQNKINVVKIITAGGIEYLVEGQGYNPQGTFFDIKKRILNPMEKPDLEKILTAGVLASNATFKNSQDPETVIIGDTTEGALITASSRADLNIDEIRKSEPKIYEVPFSSARKMMSVLTQVNETADHMIYSKGAPEVILAKCRMSGREKEKVLSVVKKMAQDGLRSLAIARRISTLEEVKQTLENNILDESGLEYLGLFAMQDPLRQEVMEALSSAKTAGIRTIMITGDHKETARTIAIAAGITNSYGLILDENDIENLSMVELIRKIKEGANVFARISPMGKLKIIEAIKSIPGTQVAVTGDGVNDAPALKAAHIGVAMGKTGTDITREVADIVIADDNYATIVEAVKEGRIIFANLVKFIRYLISCNLSEVIVVTGGVIFQTPLPLLPIQLLWINLITDGMPALALGIDPPEYDVMKKPPRDLSEGILHKKRWVYMLFEGSMMGVTTFALFLYALNNFSYPAAQTMTFATLAFSQLVHAFNNRSTRKSLFQLGIFTNKYLVVTVVLSILLQLAVIQTNWGNLIFKTQKLQTIHWLLIISVALIPFFVVELKKQLRFRLLP